jgi:transcription elongation factor Elf1
MLNSGIEEQNVRCPFCGEAVSVLLDLSAGDQSYIEDCQVCCQPMQISFECDDGSLHNLTTNCG